MPTAIDQNLLTLTQCLSPAFPTGAFAYSHGVEMGIHWGWITDAADLEAWLQDCLTHGSGRTDAIWLRLAYAAKDPQDVDAMARSFTISHERLREADRQGAAFIGTVNAVWSLTLPKALLPIAVGHTARHLDLDLETTVALFTQSFVANIVSAAIRLSPIGQTGGQQVIQALQETCLTVAEDTRGATMQDISGSAFLSDIAAMTHETLEPRLFQS